MRHPPRGVAGSGFPPLSNIPHCCLPQESGPCLSSSVADHPLRPATRHSLGKPLPYQLADRIQPHPLAPEFSHYTLECSGVWGISSRFQLLFPSKGQVSYILLTHPPLIHLASKISSFDLHVLSTPPAFTLSQDQTLHKNVSFSVMVKPLLKTKY